ncbi:transmembrane protein 230-like isoform X2 [Clavelina lepadiformis]|uniref:Transmembrane protein 230 n=1 Tax=Clavelina lepadiformis TaxID=159417 RepID=A0ABP0EY91_CLALP
MSNSAVRYKKLTRVYGGDTDGEVYSSLQFEKPEPKVPIKAIGIAFVLFLVGTVLIVIGALLLSGHIDAKYSDRTWPVLILGIITFLPGFYHLRIAYYAWRGYVGYSFEDIPDYND